MSTVSSFVPTRVHRTRLMHIWRSAGWPCLDSIEIDLLAAELVRLDTDVHGRDTLHLTSAGIQFLANARRQAQRAASRHDQLGDRMATQLRGDGRVVWRELSLRAFVAHPQTLQPPLDADRPAALAAVQESGPASLWPTPEHVANPKADHRWRMARPDLFSLRNTTVEAYLRPMVHEIKVSRADLLSDLRHEAKRQAYQWLSCECYYVFPASVADPAEVPDAFGVWLLHGDLDTGRLELARPARHTPRTLPFAVWMALAKATPLCPDEDLAQSPLAPLA
ncbi:hypothetical protein EIP75_05945 [Aquabacterium soli]|uniref:Uncharacterized protein n=1 Tax=Aquabacterium soli TaxID=2493092 RepID=A0A426VE44_9BURK|nr:hypothetical protein [Aquabacterium soli]RRS05115.1 hypothetical protein EIP75_05945 [Aquabacterium soli]